MPVEILLIRTSRTNLKEILIEIHQFSFKEMHLKLYRPQCVDPPNADIEQGDVGLSTMWLNFDSDGK